MPGPLSGLDLVRDIKHGWPETLILVITAHGTVETAVEAMRLGAHDYLTKPVDLEMLRLQVRNAFEHHRLREENRRLRERLAAAGEFPEMIGQSAAIREVFACIRQVADTDVTVLIQGESGTGKELVARAIHNLSRRRDGPFVAANVGALPETLIESELFGYEKGAFTGARAPEARLVRDGAGRDAVPRRGRRDAAQDPGRPAPRPRAAGGAPARRRGADPARRAAGRRHPPGRRRAGRRGQAPRGPVLPPQRGPPAACPPCASGGTTSPCSSSISSSGPARGTAASPSRSPARPCAILCDYSWPGNVRQLRNCMERLVVTVEGPMIHADDLPKEMQHARRCAGRPDPRGGGPGDGEGRRSSRPWPSATTTASARPSSWASASAPCTTR